MKRQRAKKVIHTFFALICVVAVLVGIYVGHELFQSRPLIFWIFTGYVVILAGIVFFLGIRLINIALTKE